MQRLTAGTLPLRAFAAAAMLIVLTSNSTATSALFVPYRSAWGLSAADIGLAFAVYVGSLIPVLLLFGGFAERFGRRTVVATGLAFMLAGTALLLGAHGLAVLLAARLVQGIGAAFAVGAISATFTEHWRGPIPAGQALTVATALALAFGPVLTAIAYDLGGGTNASYLPIFALGLAAVVLLPAFAGRRLATGRNGDAPTEAVLPADVVWWGLRFAMAAIFVAWAGTALYLSLVPAYLASALHAVNPLVGALAFLGLEIATVGASIALSKLSPHAGGIWGPVATVVGLALLVAGTSANAWSLIIVATIVVGGAVGVASGAAYAVVARVGSGQRARVFSRLLVVAYAGYSLPALLTGIVAARTSFDVGFIVVTATLGLVAAATPFLRERSLEEHLCHHALVLVTEDVAMEYRQATNVC
jgi:MFS family permease